MLPGPDVFPDHASQYLQRTLCLRGSHAATMLLHVGGHRTRITSDRFTPSAAETSSSWPTTRRQPDAGQHQRNRSLTAVVGRASAVGRPAVRTPREVLIGPHEPVDRWSLDILSRSRAFTTTVASTHPTPHRTRLGHPGSCTLGLSRDPFTSSATRTPDDSHSVRTTAYYAVVSARADSRTGSAGNARLAVIGGRELVVNPTGHRWIPFLRSGIRAILASRQRERRPCPTLSSTLSGPPPRWSSAWPPR